MIPMMIQMSPTSAALWEVLRTDSGGANAEPHRAKAQDEREPRGPLRRPHRGPRRRGALGEAGVHPPVDLGADSLHEALGDRVVVVAAKVAVCGDRSGDVITRVHIHANKIHRDLPGVHGPAGGVASAADAPHAASGATTAVVRDMPAQGDTAPAGGYPGPRQPGTPARRRRRHYGSRSGC